MSAAPCPACGEATGVAPNAPAAPAATASAPATALAPSASSTVPPAAAACAACGADLAPLQLCEALGAAEVAAAARALRRGCYREALARLDRAAALRPLGPGEWRLRGLALLGAGRPSAAAPLLGDSGPAPGAALRAAEARYGAARTLAQAGDPRGAAAALSAGPATGDGLVLYALCALRLGERAGAAAALRAALEIDPSNSHAAALLRL